jgi:precorrin-2/cobalt-factor-2 C20-methyltransferase
VSSDASGEGVRTRPGGRLVGVGVGPGDPDLLTRRALLALEHADRVLAPASAPDAVGRAEAILRAALPHLVVERLVFPMTTEPAEAPVAEAPVAEASVAEGAAAASSRAAAFAAAAERLIPFLDEGEEVAFATLGDPNVYSTFSSLAAAVRARRPGVVLATVPGVTAFQELASRSGTVLLDGSERLQLVTALEGTADLERALADPASTVVVYKGGRHAGEIAAALERAGRLEGAVLGELLGLPGERIAPLAAVAGRPAAYLATVIVPPRGRR